MSKLKNIIHNLKVKFYGAVGHAQLANAPEEAVVEPVVTVEPQVEVTEPEKPKQSKKVAQDPVQDEDLGCKTVTKKPGRPKGSASKPKS